MRAFIDLIKEALSRGEALDIFAKHGVNARTLDVKQVKKARNNLLLSLHSDLVGGNDTELKDLNAATDALVDDAKAREHGSAFDAGFDDEAESKPVRKNFHDINYVKQYFEEIAGARSPSFTVHNFDGTYFRGIFTVKGNPDLFRKMAEVMIIWDDHFRKRAIFIQPAASPDRLLLVYLDGDYLSHPVEMSHGSFNNNPGNDQQFCRRLPDELDYLSRKMRRTQDAAD